MRTMVRPAGGVRRGTHPPAQSHGGVLQSHGAPTPPAVIVNNPTYTLHVTNPANSLDTLLTNWWPEGVYMDENNGPGSFSFGMGLLDTQTALCDPSLGREVKLYRQGSLVWAGVIKSDEVDLPAQKVRFRCAGLLDYFAGRTIDHGAGRTNLLSNPGFETDAVGTRPPTSWTEVGITSVVDNSQHVLGSKSVKLTQANAGVDSYLKQTVSVTAFDTLGGDLITVAAWVRIDDSGTWVGPAIAGWGLIVRQTDGGSTVYDFHGDENALDSDTPRGSWQRFETTTWFPPGVTRTLEVRLYAPGGVVWWDALSATRMESLSGPRADQTAVASSIVDFLQGHSIYSGNGKSELNILPSCPASGVVRDFAFQYADHTSGETALNQYAALRDGFDYAVGPDRVFRTYYPRRGLDRSASVTLTSSAATGNNRTANCIVTRRVFDLAQGANDVVQLGAGDGPDREEGGATDNTVFGGVTWQKILPPTANPPIDQLDPMASQELAVAKHPVTYEVTIIDPTLNSTLQMGDTVAANFSHGYISETRNLRIVTLSRDPKDDLLRLGLNVA